MEGWIKLHRKFLSWEWFDISDMIKLFIFLSLSANHSDGIWRGVEIKRGQYLTGLNSLSEKTKISIQTLRTCLKRLEKTGEINMQVTNKYRLITVCNYDSYQDVQQATNKQPNKQLTSNQQATNSKQEEEERKKKKKKQEDGDIISIADALKMTFFPKSTEIDEAFKDYLKLRSNNKFSMTERAIKSLVKKLRELSGGDVKKALDIIDATVVGNWKTFYSLDK